MGVLKVHRASRWRPALTDQPVSSAWTTAAGAMMAVQDRRPLPVGQPLRRCCGRWTSPHAEAQLERGVQIPLDAADGQPPLFPQRGDQAEQVDAETLLAIRMATAAAIDRVVHHSVILEFDVPSYRTNAAQQGRKTD